MMPAMRGRRFVAPVLALAVLPSCAQRSFAPGQGRGLTTELGAVPLGIEVAERPQWKVGDRFVYRRGGVLRIEQAVVEAGDGGFVLEEALSRLRTRMGPSFEQVGQESPDDPWLAKELAPGDWQLAFPLWPGKQWACEFLLKTPGDAAMPILAKYVCDRSEEVETPAGRFKCLRIWRRAQPMLEGRRFLDQVALTWYAPELGYFVRRLEDGVVTELESYVRQ